MRGWVNKIQGVGAHEGLDAFDARRVRLLNGLCLLGVVASMAALPWVFIQENLQGLWGNLLSQLGMVLILGLQYRRCYRASAIVLSLVGLLGVTLQVVVFPETWGIHFWLLPLGLLPQILFFRGERVLPGVLGWAMFLAFSGCVLFTGARTGQAAAEMAAQVLAALTLMIVGVAVRRSTLEAETEALAQSERADALLHMSLPSAAVAMLKSGHRPPFEVSHDECTVLLADIVGFTGLASTIAPRDLIRILDEIFERYDSCARRLGLEKVKTIGDAYMIAAGAPEPLPNHCDAIAELALDLVRVTHEMAEERELPLDVRIGVHTGVAWGGVIGQTRIAFDIWGDTVNRAARMEQHGLPGRIHLSEETVKGLAPRFVVEERGLIDLKGIGGLRTYFLVGEGTPEAEEAGS